MPVEWSDLTPELSLQLHRDAPEPLGIQLQGALRAATRSGRLRPGERLPSSRTLAADLGVSRGLVQSTYEQLVAEGYLVASTGSATRVAATSRASGAQRAQLAVAPTARIDFAPGRPDLHSFPMRDWLWACGEAARLASAQEVGYGAAAGSLRLREVVASYLQRVRGAAATAEQLVVTTGFTQGAALTLSVLRDRGTTAVAVEDPGHLALTALVRRAGMRPVPVPVDERGLVVSALSETTATAVMVTPSHQTPTGVVLGPERRQELLRWADGCDGVIVEDDYDSEFRYDKQPVGNLQGLAPHRVVYVGSVSKALGPTMRLGWVLAPEHLVAEIAAEKQLTDHGSPGLDQIALARLMESGRYDRHLRRMRKVYAERRTALVDALAAHATGLRLTGLEAGFHALATLPEGTYEQPVIGEAARRGIAVQGLGRYRAGGATMPAGIVFGFGDLSEQAVREGIAEIADLLQPGLTKRTVGVPPDWTPS